MSVRIEPLKNKFKYTENPAKCSKNIQGHTMIIKQLWSKCRLHYSIYQTIEDRNSAIFGIERPDHTNNHTFIILHYYDIEKIWLHHYTVYSIHYTCTDWGFSIEYFEIIAIYPSRQYMKKTFLPLLPLFHYHCMTLHLPRLMNSPNDIECLNYTFLINSILMSFLYKST